MRSPKKSATCIRKPDGGLVMESKDLKNGASWLRKIPLIRGVYILIDSMIMGVKALNYSAEFFIAEEEETGFDRFMRKLFGKKAESVMTFLTMIMSFGLAILLFSVLPSLVVGFAKNYLSGTMLTVIEAIVKVTVFLTYLKLISGMRDIRRVFEYHGAEHKSIFTYENGLELKVENARPQSRLHPRCGTSFIFYVLAISIIVFAFISWDSVVKRVLLKIALLPLVAGISYEFIKLSNLPFLRPLGLPGLYLQKLTTREPDDTQLEVALCALRLSLGQDEASIRKEMNIKEPGIEETSIEEHKTDVCESSKKDMDIRELGEKEKNIEEPSRIIIDVGEPDE